MHVKDLFTDDLISTLSPEISTPIAVSVVIPTHRRASKLKILLNSLALQKSPLTFEVLVVSNFNDPKTRNVVDTFKTKIPRLRYFELGQRGVNASRNHGLAQASSELVYFLDDDCELNTSRQLETLVRLHNDFPEATAVGGGYRVGESASQAEKAYHQISWRWMQPSATAWSATWRLVGGNVSYKKSRLIENEIRFNPEIIFGGSETEMHLRLEKQGHQAILHPALFLTHHCDVGFKDLLTKGFRQGRNAGQFTETDFLDSKESYLDFDETNSVGITDKFVQMYQQLYKYAFHWGVDSGQMKRAFEQNSSRSKLTRILVGTQVLLHARWRRLKTPISIFLRWKAFSPAFATVRLFYRLSPEPIHGPRGTLKFVAKFIIFCFRKASLAGSKTSRFLHNEWKSKVTSSRSGVYIPTPETKLESEVLDLAESSRRFGHNRLVFKDDILNLKDVVSLFKKLRRDEFEIVVFYRVQNLNATQLSALTELRQSDCELIPFFNEESLLEESWSKSKIAITPSTPIDSLKKFSQKRTLGLSPMPQLIYVDFFSEKSFSAAQTYSLTSRILHKAELKNLSWEHFNLLQPFKTHALSPNRLIEGKVVWEKPNAYLKTKEARLFKWSIIVPCFENFNYLLPVIRHVFNQDYELKEIELIFIDDGSAQPLSDFLSPYLENNPSDIAVKIIRIERKETQRDQSDSTFRAGVARNAGVLHSRGECLLFLDSDILVPADHLKNLDAAFQNAEVLQNIRLMLNAKVSRDDVSIASLNLTNDTYPEDYYWESFKKTPDWNLLSAPWKYVCTYSLALKRSTFDQVGFFRPEFCEYGFEDTELGFRLFKAGLRFHLVKSRVFHLYPLDHSWSVHFDQRKRNQTIGRSAELFYRMHRDPSIFFELRSLLDPL